VVVGPQLSRSSPTSFGARANYILANLKNVIKKILADNNQTETRLDLTFGTKTSNVPRALGVDKASISKHFNGFYKGGQIAVTCYWRYIHVASDFPLAHH
jgi:hypothetical protein